VAKEKGGRGTERDKRVRKEEKGKEVGTGPQIG